MSKTQVTATLPGKTGFSLPQWFPRGRSAALWMAILAIGAGPVFEWDWLVAAGWAPLILSALPCLAMCAIGLCAMRGNAKSWHGEKAEPKVADPKASSSQP